MTDRNENKPGYKETKVGWIPKEWDIPQLSGLVEPDKPIVYGIVQAGEHIPNGIPYIRSTDIGAQFVSMTELLRTSPEIAAKYKRSTVNEGNVIFSLRGNLGETSIVPDGLDGANLTQGTARIAVNKQTSSLFVHYAVGLHTTKKLVDAWAKGSTFREITIEDLRKLPVTLPSLPEQEKIAEVLSCWDEGTQSLEKLIEEKKLRKKGLMQQLLTGKKRLPGFSKVWKEVELREICTVLKDKVGEKRVVPMSISAGKGFVPQTEKFGKDISGKQYVNYTLLKRGYFSYNKGNSKRYPQGCTYLLEEHDEVAVPNVFISFKLDEAVADDAFYQQVFLANMHGRDLIKFINSGVRNDGLLNLNTAWFLRLKLPLPPTLDEQQAIAEVLQTADEDIQGLEDQLDALNEQKKGLMQKLLTGEVRCPEFRDRQ